MKVYNKLVKSKKEPFNKSDIWFDGKNINVYKEGKWSAVTSPLNNMTYSELLNLRNTHKLIPGQQYRITDYMTTTAQANTRSAGNQFDVIVTAVNENTLNEVARACLHEGDTYFSEAGANLAAWKLWYCLDNDINRFAWADVVKLEENITSAGEKKVNFTVSGVNYNGSYYSLSINEEVHLSYGPPIKVTLTNDNILFVSDDSGYISSENPIMVVGFQEGNGKGVIYRMIDEWDNDIPYDFKNIIYIDKAGFLYSQWGKDSQFVRDSSLDKDISGTQYYGYTTDDIPNAWSEGKCWVTDAIVTSGSQLYYADGSTISYGGSISNIVSEDAEYYTFRDADKDASLNKETHSNIVNKRVINGQHLLNKNIFGADCHSNQIGDNAYDNTFGAQCYDNTIDGGYTTFRGEIHYSHSNTFGENCYSNSLGNSCHSNSFGNVCHSNSFGNSCNNNSFGDNCSSNSFGNYCYGNSFSNNCNNNSFGNNCYSNSLGNSCHSNSFGNSCNNNSLDTSCHSNSFGNSCNNNSLGNNCQCNRFDNYCCSNSFGSKCKSNSFNNNCDSNILTNDCCYNSFGNYCHHNTFSDDCEYNSLDNGCYGNSLKNSGCNNSFGNDCHSNSFGNNCIYNSFGNNCSSNSLGKTCNSNIFGNNCNSNSFGDSCSNNSFGSSCINNSFGNNCYTNSFGNDCYNNRFCGATLEDKGHYYESNHFGDSVEYCVFTNSETASSTLCVRYYNIAQGVAGRNIEVTRSLGYETKVAVPTSGGLKMFNLADLA